ncbi:hypothetical protein [Flavobacterium terrisoli]|uniref:hypothetical protein n=1 Tax=Flavobacterium terrisoli TaxID=3242195 RepID=UPI002542E721|nr:hypothetical protein [Flavobacterium buctense]
MFKKTQKYLLLNHPLLWNTKVVPLTCFALLMHVVFLIVGYINGALNFNETDQNYSSGSKDIILFFGFLISFLSVVIWLVYYFKNNAFKAFYPKSNFALFREWLLILCISFMLCSFTISFLFGNDLRIKSYYTENEARKRCETLSKASIFYGENFDEAQYEKKMVNDTLRPVELDHVLFNNKKYSLTSLINKGIENYSFFDTKWDSLTKIKVKNWLVNDEKDSVKVVMKNFFAMVKEHKLQSNIDENQWFTLVYTAPKFIQKRIIAGRERDYYSEVYNYEADYARSVTYPDLPPTAIDTLNQYLKMIGKDKFIYYKTYVPADELEYNYQKIAYTYVSPSIQLETFLGFIYFAIGISIVVFSFKVTSGKSWLIALISMGVLNIALGICAATSSSEYYYFGGLILVTLVLFFYFVFVLYKKTEKGISGITLNGLLWLLPAFIPMVYIVTVHIMKIICGYYNSNFNYDDHPVLRFLDENDELMLCTNIIFIVVMMLFFSIKIKAWRALADN